MNIDAEKIFSRLITIRKKIGAELIHYELMPLSKPIITIDIDSIEKAKAARIILDNPSGLFTLGRNYGCLLLYIPYNYASKYHFTLCSTIKTMKRIGRLDRYRLTNRRTGFFAMSDGMNARLDVCRNCIKEFGKKHPHLSKKLWHDWRDFSIDKLFDSTYQFIPEEYIDRIKMGVILEDVYPENWQDISRAFRKLKHWRCDNCGISLKDRPGLLHVHHKNGIKTDTSYNNLQSLCLLCHSEIHGHMKPLITDEERKFIYQRRKDEQQFQD